MDDLAPCVARVLLVALPARSRVLTPAMCSACEPVTYAIEAVHPRVAFVNARAGGRSACRWPLVVVDGESFTDEDALEDLLPMLRTHCDLVASILYISRRLPSERDAELAFTWADDAIEPGWRFEDRLRRRVQLAALAPWRRSMGLRLEAERLGDRRLHVLRPLVAARRESCAGRELPGEEG